MGETSTAAYRQERIKDLLKKEAISDQKALVELLKEVYGIQTNQTVVSRDLRKLGVIKKSVGEVMVYELPTVDIQTKILKLALVDMTHNETMIVLKTQPGLAAFVGDYLDQCTDLGIIGCLAGENVVFVIPASIKKMAEVCERISQRCQFKKIKDMG